MPPGFRDDTGAAHSVNTTVRVMAVVIPCFLALSVAYVLYAVAGFVLMNQYDRAFHMAGTAVGVVVPYAVVAALMVWSYLRVITTVYTNPGIVPLGPEHARGWYGTLGSGPAGRAAPTPCERIRASLRASFGGKKSAAAAAANAPAKSGAGSDAENVDLESGLARSVPYGGTGAAVADPRLDPDSPGLELFYTKDVFQCTADGRPVWCSSCGTWKPDRAHHCSEINRCVLKMDHFCPWVGGIVSETTFKYFVQFTFYASIFCGITIGTSGGALWERRHRGLGSDGRVVASLALAAVLGLFALAMFATCLGFVLRNTTTVESHQLKDRVRTMAVRIKRGSPPVAGRYGTVTYPLPRDDAPPAYGAVPPLSQPAGQEPEPDPIRAKRAARAARRLACEALDVRDMLAYRTYAVIAVPKGMNVWDLGWYGNWTSVMGTNVLDWLLPVRGSPCCDHDSTDGFYKVSPAFQAYCDGLDLPACTEREQRRHW